MTKPHPLREEKRLMGRTAETPIGAWDRVATAGKDDGGDGREG